MHERYEIVSTETITNIDKKMPTYTKIKIVDKDNKNCYTCIVEDKKQYPFYNSIRQTDDKLNGFDLATTLFLYDIDMYAVLPRKFISKEIDEMYEQYHPGNGNRCIYKNKEEFIKAYDIEENRTRDIPKQYHK